MWNFGQEARRRRLLFYPNSKSQWRPEGSCAEEPHFLDGVLFFFVFLRVIQLV